MSVSSTVSRIQQACNGSVTQFPFSFPIIDTSDLKVILTNPSGEDTELTETTDYSVSATNDDYSSGGTVTTVQTYATGYMITIYRDVEITQEEDFIEGMPTLYETFESGLDKLTMIAQQLYDKLLRSLVAPESDLSTTALELPSSSDRALKYLAFDADGRPIASSTSLAETPVSSFCETLLDDETPAAARTTLELNNVTNVAQIPLSYLDTDITLSANSDTKVATQKATKAYVDALKTVLPGSMIDWPTETVPDGYLERNGASLDRTTYADLFAVIGTTYGAVDSTHFNIPDHRGRFPRYWDHAKGNDPDAASRTKVTATGATMTAGDHVGTEQADQFESHYHSMSTAGLGYEGGAHILYDSGSGRNTSSNGGNETRPINVNVMPLIKY